MLTWISYLQAPIYVSKQVVLNDAIRISYRTGQVHGAKPCYDVQLDRYLLFCMMMPLMYMYIILAPFLPPIVISLFNSCSAPDGPDLLLEELGGVKNMHLAVEEERYFDAGVHQRKLVTHLPLFLFP